MSLQTLPVELLMDIAESGVFPVSIHAFAATCRIAYRACRKLLEEDRVLRPRYQSLHLTTGSVRTMQALFKDIMHRPCLLEYVEGIVCGGFITSSTQTDDMEDGEVCLMPDINRGLRREALLLSVRQLIIEINSLEAFTQALPKNGMRKLCTELFSLWKAGKSPITYVAFMFLPLASPNLKSLRLVNNERDLECLEKTVAYLRKLHSTDHDDHDKILTKLSAVELIHSDRAIDELHEYQLIRSLPGLKTLRAYGLDSQEHGESNFSGSAVETLELAGCRFLPSNRSEYSGLSIKPFERLRNLAIRVGGRESFSQWDSTEEWVKWESTWMPVKGLASFKVLKELQIDGFVLGPQFFRQCDVETSECYYEDHRAHIILTDSNRPTTPLLNLLPKSLEILQLAIAFRPELHDKKNEDLNDKVAKFFEGLHSPKRNKSLPKLREIHLYPRRNEDHKVLRRICPTSARSGIVLEAAESFIGDDYLQMRPLQDAVVAR
ncbi:MAG: hypothetical protein M1831_000783 [Alyxoria varia]|nr:MAG: hypothetical protein M1831_000783 [Alyxoria varia]